MDRLIKLNELWRLDVRPFGVLLAIAVAFVTITASMKLFRLFNYKWTISWIILSVVSLVVIFALTLLTPTEIRWYAIILGLVWPVSFSLAFSIMQSLLSIAIKRSKVLANIIWVASLVLIICTSVSLATWPATKQLGFMAGFGGIQALTQSRYVFRHAKVRRDAGDKQ